MFACKEWMRHDVTFTTNRQHMKRGVCSLTGLDWELARM